MQTLRVPLNDRRSRRWQLSLCTKGKRPDELLNNVSDIQSQVYVDPGFREKFKQEIELAGFVQGGARRWRSPPPASFPRSAREPTAAFT